jgi:hypothetical protein
MADPQAKIKPLLPNPHWQMADSMANPASIPRMGGLKDNQVTNGNSHPDDSSTDMPKVSHLTLPPLKLTSMR